MKKMWKFRKDSRAVSPVIATILMVAITVVLAAVLYVMVSGYGGGGETAPTGDFSGAQKTSATTEKLTFGPFSKDVKPTDIKLVVANGTGTPYTWTFPANDVSGALTCNGTQVDLSVITYADLGGDKKVSSGDYVTLT
ncbi:MAG TPA: type IV pilin N-terminal domain-containing protein, partial [Methanomassiliicoccales archaeon]|nr:type IV pilin N-terminal domain-containing protein [Methanomassiliicoccales archaeon]